MKIAKSMTIAAASFAMLYLCAAFIVWDLAWAQELPNWKPEGRIMFLMMMGFLPAWIGTGTYIFSK